MQKLIHAIQKRVEIDEDLKRALNRSFLPEKIKRKAELLRNGNSCKKLYFLETGTVRTFYFHEEKEVTSWFYKEDLFFTSWYSFYTQKEGYECIEALEDAVVYSIHYNDYINLINSSQKFERFARLLAEEQIAFTDQFFKGFMFLSAKQKYDLLLLYFPDIELRVKLIYIASFLGISRETLSRIRAEK